MNQNQRTLVFVIVAVIAVGVAAMSNWITQPRTVAGFEKVGQPFFPDFDDPNEAAALRVVTYNEDTASANPFMVEYRDGAWRIPSRHNYPADGKERLAKTAASIVGIVRGALASRRVSDHERFGVVDPLDDEAATLKGRGHRVTLFKQGKNVLVDFIVGNKVEGQDKEYYVRRADEKETYIATLDLDVSTKFSDWVEADLLKLDRNTLTKLHGSRPVIDAQNRIIDQETVELTRDSSTDDWKLDGLDEEKEELKTSDISSMEWALDDLKLVGVRPKPQHEGSPLLAGDLTFHPPASIANSPELYNIVLTQLKQDLASHGFFLGPDRKDPKQTRVYSREGNLIASTNKGVAYYLNFGNLFTGTEEEIEIGESASDDAAEAKDDAEKKSDETEADNEKIDDEKKADKDADTGSKLSKSRYLFVRAAFDASLLGDKPVEPVKPEKPAGFEESSEGDKKPKDDAAKNESNSSANSAKKQDKDVKSVDKDAASKADADASGNDEEDKKDPKAEYDEALKKYEEALKKYQDDLKVYEKKVEDGGKEVKELNDRFADWYYVISEDSFEKLRLSRKELVKLKEEPETKDDQNKSTDKEDETASETTKQPPQKDTIKPPQKTQPKTKPAKNSKSSETKPEPAVSKDAGHATGHQPATKKKPSGSPKAAGSDTSSQPSAKTQDKQSKPKKPASDKPAASSSTSTDKAKPKPTDAPQQSVKSGPIAK